MRVGRIAASLLGIVLFALVAGWFTKKAGLDILMLRAESGRYLEAAQTTGTARASFISQNITQSYGGHFTPIAFWFELKQSQFFNTHGKRWLWRQMLALSVLGLSIAWLMARVGQAQGLGRPAIVAGAGAALIYLFQPTTVEMAMWPFMLMQFLCLTAMACSEPPRVSWRPVGLSQAATVVTRLASCR